MPQSERHDTRERIVEATAAAFGARGYAGVNLNEVVKQLGLTKGAMYFYFASKDDLVCEIIARYAASLDDLTEPKRLSANPLEGLIKSSQSVIDDFLRNPISRAGARLAHERNLISASVADPNETWRRNVEALLRAAKRAKQIKSTVDEQRIADLLIDCLVGMQRASNDRKGASLSDQLQLFWKMALTGLQTQPADTPKKRSVKASVTRNGDSQHRAAIVTKKVSR